MNSLPSQAVLFLSGNLMDGYFNLESLAHLKNRLTQTLSERNSKLTREIVVLTPERFSSAEVFLKARFEIVPSDDENLEIALLALSSLQSATPPDEIVFGFANGGDLKSLARRLSGLTRRTVITRDDEPSEETLAYLDETFDIRPSLIVDKSTLQKTSYCEKRELPKNDVQVSISLENDYQLDDAKNVPAWADALEKFVLNHNKKASVFNAVTLLQDEYPELLQLYQTNKERLRAVLPSSIRWIHENRESILYHATHSDLRQVSPQKATKILTFSGPSETEEEKYPVVPNVQTFKDIADRSEVMQRQCLWSIDRQELVNSGANHQEVIYPKDQELEQEGKVKGVFLWPIRHPLSPDQYKMMADCYHALSVSFQLLDEFSIPENQIAGGKFLAMAAQVAADAQCLIKSGLQQFGLSLATDAIQRDAFQLLLDFGRKNDCFLKNMRLSDTLDLSLVSEIQQRCETLKEDFQQAKKNTRSLKNCERLLDYHLKKIVSQSTSNLVHDWTRIVEAVTGLCDDFKVPPSSLLFRNRLENIVHQIPDEVEITTAFGQVVQQIELYQQQKEEETFLLDPPDPNVFSPAVQAIRDRYNGAKTLFVGGTPQEHLRTRLESRLNIQLIWSETNHGDSLERFSSLLYDDDVRLILIYIPWCSHKHSEEFASLAKQANKDFVRLRKGTNPEQIALAACQQLQLDVLQA